MSPRLRTHRRFFVSFQPSAPSRLVAVRCSGYAIVAFFPIRAAQSLGYFPSVSWVTFGPCFESTRISSGVVTLPKFVTNDLDEAVYVGRYQTIFG